VWTLKADSLPVPNPAHQEEPLAAQQHWHSSCDSNWQRIGSGFRLIDKGLSEAYSAAKSQTA
jgi:hypothetical protein